MNKRPKVSILCITYNQAKYVRQTLDSFLIQKTDFRFEILINDDASTDGTVEIIKEYQEKYPGIIRSVFQDENLYSKGVRNMMTRFLFPIAKGEYIALCEGDDYWTDPNKLQTQVDFLEKNPDFALCFHPVKVIYEKGDQKDSIFPPRTSSFTTKELLRENFIQTNSVVYRRQEYKHVPTNITPGDWYLHLYHAQFGKIGFINKVMSVYRRHPRGIWWNSHKNIDQIWKNHGIAHLRLYMEMNKIYGNNSEYKKIINQHINKLLETLIEVDKKHKTKIILQVAKISPEQLCKFTSKQHFALINQSRQVGKLKEQASETEKIISEQNINLSALRHKLNMIESSRIWRARNKLAPFLRRDKV